MILSKNNEKTKRKTIINNFNKMPNFYYVIVYTSVNDDNPPGQTCFACGSFGYT